MYKNTHTILVWYLNEHFLINWLTAENERIQLQQWGFDGLVYSATLPNYISHTYILSAERAHVQI